MREKLSEGNLFILSDNYPAIHVSLIYLSHGFPASSAWRQNPGTRDSNYGIDPCFPVFQHFRDCGDLRAESESGTQVETDAGVDVSFCGENSRANITRSEIIPEVKPAGDSLRCLNQFFCFSFILLSYICLYFFTGKIKEIS